MRRLRAIGGPRDGEWIEVRQEHRGDLIRLPVGLPRRGVGGLNDPLDPLAYTHVHYRVEQLQFRWEGGAATLEFLVHHDELKLSDALARVLTEWGPPDAAD